MIFRGAIQEPKPEWCQLAIDVFVYAAVIYASLFALMSLGLTLTYMTTEVPNFAHGSLVTLGAYVAYSLYRFIGLNAYGAIPIAFLLSGLVALAMYRIVLRPLAARGSSTISLMIATLSIDVVFVGIFGIYTDLLNQVLRFSDSRYFVLIGLDFSLYGQRGVFYVATVLLAIITVTLYLVLTRTRFGLAMRASVENPSLAMIDGINVQRVYIVSWLIGGGLAGLAGAIIILWVPGSPHIGTDLIIAIFSASILGGMKNIYGSVIGGVLVGGGEIFVTVYAARLLGSWVMDYQIGVPLLIMALTLLLAPKGITALKWGSLLESRGS